jgi:hypothetical protein
MNDVHFYNARYMLLAVMFSVVMLVPPQTFAQSREYLLKAGYIEKFTHFIEWPGASNTKDSTIAFTVAVIGENKFGNAIEKIFSE